VTEQSRDASGATDDINIYINRSRTDPPGAFCPYL